MLIEVRMVVACSKEDTVEVMSNVVELGCGSCHSFLSRKWCH